MNRFSRLWRPRIVPEAPHVVILPQLTYTALIAKQSWRGAPFALGLLVLGLPMQLSDHTWPIRLLLLAACALIVWVGVTLMWITHLSQNGMLERTVQALLREDSFGRWLDRAACSRPSATSDRAKHTTPD